jgi:4-diphosphocytidyl-2C-methyl-D-erythritol kinase
METCITTRAPAKINVTLEVIGKLSDDYHHIRSVLVKLYKLADVIDIRIGAEINGVTISSDNGDLPLDQQNICYQAALGYLRAGRPDSRCPRSYSQENSDSRRSGRRKLGRRRCPAGTE